MPVNEITATLAAEYTLPSWNALLVLGRAVILNKMLVPNSVGGGVTIWGAKNGGNIDLKKKKKA